MPADNLINLTNEITHDLIYQPNLNLTFLFPSCLIDQNGSELPAQGILLSERSQETSTAKERSIEG